MSPRQIDRAAWAALIADLIQRETAGNKTRFADLIGVDRKTVTRWLALDMAVSEESVTKVARALRIRAGDILIRLGYYQPSDLIANAREEPGRPTVDEHAIQAIEDADIEPELRRRLLDHLAAQRDADERRRVEDIQRVIDLTRRRRSG